MRRKPPVFSEAGANAARRIMAAYASQLVKSDITVPLTDLLALLSTDKRPATERVLRSAGPTLFEWFVESGFLPSLTSTNVQLSVWPGYRYSVEHVAKKVATMQPVAGSFFPWAALGDDCSSCSSSPSRYSALLAGAGLDADSEGVRVVNPALLSDYYDHIMAAEARWKAEKEACEKSEKEEKEVAERLKDYKYSHSLQEWRDYYGSLSLEEQAAFRKHYWYLVPLHGAT